MGVWPRLIVVAVFAGAASGATMQHPSTGSAQAVAPGHYSAPLPYDGRFTFVRLRWGADLPSSSGRGGFGSAWNHDYPRAEQHLSAIIRELTYLDVHDDGNEILALDDPDLFKFPIALMWEPGFWNLTDREAESFSAYLLKGGFAVFEDFDGGAQWANFEAQMLRVLPDARFVKLDQSHHIFDS